MQIELKRIGNKAATHPHPRFAVVVQPPVEAEKFVHQLVEHFVVAELDVATKVPCEAVLVDDGLGETTGKAACFQHQPVADATLLEALRRAEARRACADDQMSYVHGWDGRKALRQHSGRRFDARRDRPGTVDVHVTFACRVFRVQR